MPRRRHLTERERERLQAELATVVRENHSFDHVVSMADRVALLTKRSSFMALLRYGYADGATPDEKALFTEVRRRFPEELANWQRLNR